MDPPFDVEATQMTPSRPQASVPVSSASPSTNLDPNDQATSADSNESEVDSGAQEIVHSILDALDDPLQGEDGLTRIGLSSLRNQSRSDRATFESMRRELMNLLTRAGRKGQVVFTDAEEVALQYRLEGTAYRLGDERSPRWELYLQLHREEDGLLVWEPDGVIQIRPENLRATGGEGGTGGEVDGPILLITK